MGQSRGVMSAPTFPELQPAAGTDRPPMRECITSSRREITAAFKQNQTIQKRKWLTNANIRRRRTESGSSPPHGVRSHQKRASRG